VLAERPKLLDVREAAEVLGFQEERVRRWVREGKLPARKIGQKWRFRPEDLEDVLEGEEETPRESRSRLLTVMEAADHLRFHPEHVRRLTRQGKLPGRKIGNEWRYRPEDLDAIFEDPKEADE
jgi:excisionase family DNA binding protein